MIGMVLAPPSTRPGATAAPWSLQALPAATFLMHGVGRYAGGHRLSAGRTGTGVDPWLRYALGTTEIVGGAAMLWLPAAALAAAVLVLVMTGEAISQVVLLHNGSPITAIALGVLAVIAFGAARRREEETTRARPHGPDAGSTGDGGDPSSPHRRQHDGSHRLR